MKVEQYVNDKLPLASNSPSKKREESQLRDEARLFDTPNSFMNSS